MTKRNAQFWLSGCWVAGAVLLAGVLAFQTIGSSMLQGHEEVLWKWLSGALLPNATLMFGVLGAQAFSREQTGRVTPLLFILAMLTSVAYLILVGVVIALVALRFSMRPLEVAQGPVTFIQAINQLLIGVFFVRDGPPGESAKPE